MIGEGASEESIKMPIIVMLLKLIALSFVAQ